METHCTVWFFERASEQRQLEIRSTIDGRGFEMIVRHANGAELVERWDRAADLMLRQEKVAFTWRAEGWHAYVPEDSLDGV